MKPFDLKAALNGAPVVTREGEEVPWIAHDPGAAPNYRVVARVMEEGGRCMRLYTEKGVYYDAKVSKHDLFMDSGKRTVWVVLWLDLASGSLRAAMFDDEHAGRFLEGRKRADGHAVYGTFPIEIEE